MIAVTGATGAAGGLVARRPAEATGREVRFDDETHCVQRPAGHEPYMAEEWLREHPDSHRHLV